MNNLAGAIGDLLGSNQRDDEDEDINTPLKPSKHGSRRTKTRSGRSSTTCLTISLIAFAAAFILCLIFLATSTISEGAWFSHWGFGDTSAVRTNRHIQNHDWKRTAGADRMDTSGLEKKIQHLERELQAANRGRRAAQPRAAAPHKTKKVDPWGHEDYVDEVEKKEKAEEDSINRKLSKEDKDSLHLDTEGLDKKHRNLLRAEKKAIDMQNAYARKAAAKDYSRRQKEIDEIMPSDIDC
ncbi:hypothetical protein GUITHDRAFT_156030 [Guillardia theta CCMP2712]|uniref:Uncharacterized protein n=3 Tax=Guillardia theta TaxID=55529 RepID=L1IBM9_GUITC|nr:hypothetical protein GUITHDRAFT_156030 [Guillardia theta CCMP2712]EKX33492.1 hypothetical protein GUITHDRAFT_156030 [Guillardia theta CCMP2712]|mmetsp:Transcript_46100/g.144629  ORF Transcript_46100/g.144629 Transcript_46100/m.144629 type:complete len:239 (+) Transcript_46100:227-943(+)|eukprot:XP_005820472.1 hypothetical protein GUITHDRAFT_156030 [Guillardia theta CCMP2712]